MKLPGFVTPERWALGVEFLQFGIVGTSGAVADIAAAYSVVGWVGPYWAGAFSYVVAATWTWWLNRTWTWRGRGTGPLWKEWLRWMGVNTSGLLFSRGLYYFLITVSPYCHDHIYLPILLGAFLGMFANFFLSRRLVIR